MSTIAHHTCTPASRCWCVRATKGLLEANLERMQIGDLCSDGRQDGVPWPIEKAVGRIFQGAPLEGRISEGLIVPHLKRGHP